MAGIKKGQIVGVLKLKNEFDRYAVHLLSDYIERDYDGEEKKSDARRQAAATKAKPTNGKRPRRATTRKMYKIVKDLPTREAYEEIKARQFTRAADDVMSEAYSEFETLAGELRDWYDNLPESFQNGEKGEILSASADTLEDLQSPSDPTGLNRISVYCPPNYDAESRSDRCGEAADMLNRVADAIEEFVEEWRNPEDGQVPKVEDGEEPPDLDGLEDIISELRDHASQAGDVEFPGMYG